MVPIDTRKPGAYDLEGAYRYCEKLAKSHYENFTVGSLLIPGAKRRHVYAIYAYCRWVDDIGDEPPSYLFEAASQAGWMPGLDVDDIDPGQGRLKLLDRWKEELDLCYEGRPTHPVLVALQDTVRTFDIPMDPFLKLIEANRMEQQTLRYPTYDDLLYYCDYSANPVGHLFLYLFGHRDAERQKLADLTCTALQLTNFWQDVARDYKIGRIYIPLEDMQRFGYTEAELADGVANDRFRSLMAYEVERAKGLFIDGFKLVDTLNGVLKMDVALFTMGGMAVLRAIEGQGYDVLTHRPSLSRTRKASLFISTWIKLRLGGTLGLD